MTRHVIRAWIGLIALAFAAITPCIAQSSPQDPVPKQSVPAPQRMASGVLAVVSDTAGMLFVDGQRRFALIPEKVVTINLTAGQHFVDLRNAKDEKLWEKIINVPVGAQVAERLVLSQTSPRSSASDRQEGAAVLPVVARPPVKSFEEVVPFSQFPLLPTKDEAEKQWQECREIAAAGKISQSESNCTPPILARALYVLGQYVDALRYSSDEIKLNEKWEALRPSDPKSSSACQAYALRSRIRHNLSDDSGALRDINAAGACKSKYDNDLPSLYARFPASYVSLQTLQEVSGREEQDLHLYRAIVLMGLRRFEEAMLDVNGPMDEFHLIAAMELRTDIQLAMFRDPGIPASVVNAGWDDAANAANNSEGLDQSVSPGTDVAAKIDEIVSSGRYSTLPPPQATVVGGTQRPSLLIKNQTAFELTVLMAGPVERSISIQPAGSQNLVLPPGSYRVLGQVKASNVLPFYGTQVYATGGSYEEAFYIK